MTVERSTDASSTSPPLTWKTIDWSRARQEVRRLQMRIAKATQAGQHRKAEALQWVLTHSRSAKLLAVHRVTTNRGARTPGVDGVRWRTGRQKLLWLSRRPPLRRCPGTVLPGALKQNPRPMGAGRRHPGLFGSVFIL